MSIENYKALNKAAWNIRTDVHLESEFYGLEDFINGKSSLNQIEKSLLGDVAGKNLLHLQCHFGQDSLSLARMGAKVTGVDISDKAIMRARELNEKLGLNANFVCSDIYDFKNSISEQFDIVFTSYGTIGWLPDLNKWASVIERSLKPGGRFIFVEFHPVIWMYDNDFTKPVYRYFKAEPIIENEKGTYADRNATIEYETVSWNHSLGEVLSSLLDVGLTITSFQEYDYSPYACFYKTIEFEPGKYRIEGMEDFMPMLYSLSCTKPL